MPGRIDTHSHLLPAVDDGCETVADSLECARRLVDAGYARAFCTPHVWQHLPHNNVREIRRRTAALQAELDAAGVPLTLSPGGEINLQPHTAKGDAAEVVTYGLARRSCLFDIWADDLPDFFEPAVRRLQAIGLRVILAHPERMGAVQRDPGLVGYFDELGLLLQGNLQCLSDPADAATRRLVERFLEERRYFMLGSDTHRPATLQCRLDGLRRAIALLGEREVDRLTIENPSTLLPAPGA